MINEMNRFTLRDRQDIKRDTNSILEKITSNIYSLDKLRTMVPGTSEHQRVMDKIDSIEDKVSEFCPDFNLNLNQHNAIVTITLNGLILSICIIDLSETEEDVKYAHVDVFCSISNNIQTHTYLMEEAERYVLSKGLKYMAINVPITNMVPYIGLGFVPLYVSNMDFHPENEEPSIVRILRESKRVYNNTYKFQQKKPINPFEVLVSQPVVLNLLKYTLPLDAMEVIRNNDPRQINEWENLIQNEESDIIIDGSSITLTKDVMGTRTDTGEPLNYTSNSIVNTMEDGVNRFMNMVKVKTEDLEDSDIFNDEERFDSICQGEVSMGFSTTIRKGIRGQNVIMSIEVSGVTLAFCILEFHDMNINTLGKRNAGNLKPWMYIHVICARENSGIGGRLLQSAEKFAMKNGVMVVRLNALYGVVQWYQSKNYKLGFRLHGNDPNSTRDKTPTVNMVLENISDAVDLLLQGDLFDHGLSEQQVAAIDTDQNRQTRRSLEDLIRQIYPKPAFLAARFISDYQQLLLKLANDLNVANAMNGEWMSMESLGVSMDKNLEEGL